MKKSYAIKVLNRIQLIRHLHDNFRKWGIDISEYDDPTISLLEEAIPTLYATNEKEYEEILGWMQWWLYEDVEKIITINGNAEDLTKVGDFIDYIENLVPKHELTDTKGQLKAVVDAFRTTDFCVQHQYGKNVYCDDCPIASLNLKQPDGKHWKPCSHQQFSK